MSRLAISVIGMLLLASTVFAANGDLIVDGNLGVGTSTPGSNGKLSVNGSLYAANAYTKFSTYLVQPATFVPINVSESGSELVRGTAYRVELATTFTGGTTGSVYVVYQTAVNAWTAKLVANNGTSSNNPQLRVNGLVLEVFHNHANGYYISVRIRAVETGNTTILSPSFFGLDGVLTASEGNVGIGTVAPKSKLQVLGTLLVGNEDGTAPFRVSIGGSGGDYGSVGYNFKPTTTTGAYNYLANDTASRIEFKSGGFIFKTAASGSAGNTIPFNDAVTISSNGNVVVNGTVTASNGLLGPSDVIFKKSLLPIIDPLSKVNNLRGVSYEWKTDDYKEKGFQAGRHYGVIAQEIEKVLPEVVSTAPDGTKAVTYTEIIPVLIEAIKEQQQRIEALEKRLAATP